MKTNNYVGNIKLEKIKSGLKKLIRGGQNNNARSKFDSKFNRYYLGKLNLGVETVIDIGVYNGTPELYNAFSSKKIVLIDPLPLKDLSEEMQSKGYDVQSIELGVGSQRKTKVLDVAGSRSTFLTRTRLTPTGKFEATREDKIMEIDTLDNLIVNSKYLDPYGLKIDVEGYEIEVLKGAEKVLDKNVFIILEYPLCKRYQEQHRASEIIKLLSDKGFELFDILDINPKGKNTFLGLPSRHLDALFVPYNSELYSDNSGF